MHHSNNNIACCTPHALPLAVYTNSHLNELCLHWTTPVLRRRACCRTVTDVYSSCYLKFLSVDAVDKPRLSRNFQIFKKTKILKWFRIRPAPARLYSVFRVCSIRPLENWGKLFAVTRCLFRTYLWVVRGLSSDTSLKSKCVSSDK